MTGLRQERERGHLHLSASAVSGRQPHLRVGGRRWLSAMELRALGPGHLATAVVSQANPALGVAGGERSRLLIARSEQRFRRLVVEQDIARRPEQDKRNRQATRQLPGQDQLDLALRHQE